MADTEITLLFNAHRYEALERILTESGSSVENELLRELNGMYRALAPENERAAIESKIERENAEAEAASEAARRFAVVHLHDSDDDLLFTTELRNDFYSMAYLYRNELKDMVGQYTLDSLAERFGSYQVIDETVFSALCHAKPNDPRITALVEFDFEHNTVSVCSSGDDEWHTYDLKDVSAAFYRANRKNHLPLTARQEIFSEAVVEKEIRSDTEMENEARSDRPTLQM